MICLHDGNLAYFSDGQQDSAPDLQGIYIYHVIYNSLVECLFHARDWKLMLNCIIRSNIP